MGARVTAYVGLGSNLGDALDNVQRAIRLLAELPDSSLEAQSSLFRSAPIDAGGDDYVNAVVRLTTALPAQALLERLQAIELDFGRERPYVNAPRTLDLDVLLYGEQMIETATLMVPHARMTERAFVLIPLLQVNPFVTIPGMGAAHAFVQGVAGQAIEKIVVG